MREEDVTELSRRRKRVLGRLFTRISTAMQERANRALHARGYDDIKMMHNAVLIHLDAEGTRATVLAERARMTKAGIGKIIRDLEELGYVTRRPDPADGRAQLVQFTPRSLEMMEVALEHFDEVEQDLIEDLGGPEAFERFHAQLTMLAERMDEGGF